MKPNYEYQTYMEEYIDSAQEEMDSFYLEAGQYYNETFYLREHLFKPYIEKALDDQKKRDKLIDFVVKFMDDHSAKLTTSGPVHMIPFTDTETSFLYEFFGVTKEEVLSIFNNMNKETWSGKLTKFLVGFVVNAPHKLLIVGVIIYGLQKKLNEMVEVGEYLMGFAEYPIVFRKFWKIGVREDIMNHTIEHLANKFKAKKVNNVQELIKYDMHKAMLNFESDLTEGKDSSYTDLIYRVRTQLNSTFRNLSNEYFKNWENNATELSKSGKFDDGTLADQDGYNTNISSIVENTYSKIITSGINTSWISAMADANQVDSNNLSMFTGKVYTTKDNKLYKFIENVITIYFMKNPTDTSIGSREFLNFGIGLFKSIGTSKVELYKELKQILSYWLYDIIKIDEHYPKGGTTVSNYSRAIFNYFIFVIHGNNQ